jgi:exopolyphosphatase/pppGpp-phosphohydrolase
LRSFLSNEVAPSNLVDENSSPSLLNAEQRTALAVLCEAIVPGSKAAHSAPFIELLLSVDTAKAQQEFLASLAALESESQKSFHTRIATLTPAQLRELLSAISAQEHTAHEYFANLKDWSVTAYYSSEIGMRELGWTPDRVFANFPECQHPDGHL